MHGTKISDTLNKNITHKNQEQKFYKRLIRTIQRHGITISDHHEQNIPFILNNIQNSKSLINDIRECILQSMCYASDAENIHLAHYHAVVHLMQLVMDERSSYSAKMHEWMKFNFTPNDKEKELTNFESLLAYYSDVYELETKDEICSFFRIINFPDSKIIFKLILEGDFCKAAELCDPFLRLIVLLCSKENSKKRIKKAFKDVGELVFPIDWKAALEYFLFSGKISYYFRMIMHSIEWNDKSFKELYRIAKKLYLDSELVDFYANVLAQKAHFNELYFLVLHHDLWFINYEFVEFCYSKRCQCSDRVFSDPLEDYFSEDSCLDDFVIHVCHQEGLSRFNDFLTILYKIRNKISVSPNELTVYLNDKTGDMDIYHREFLFYLKDLELSGQEAILALNKSMEYEICDLKRAFHQKIPL